MGGGGDRVQRDPGKNEGEKKEGEVAGRRIGAVPPAPCQVPDQCSFCPSSHGPSHPSVEAGAMMNPFPVPQFPCLQSESRLSGFCGLKWNERGGKGLGNEGGQRGEGRRRGGARRGECSSWSTIHEGTGASADTDRLLRKPGSSEHSPPTPASQESVGGCSVTAPPPAAHTGRIFHMFS